MESFEGPNALLPEEDKRTTAYYNQKLASSYYSKQHNKGFISVTDDELFRLRRSTRRGSPPGEGSGEFKCAGSLDEMALNSRGGWYEEDVLNSGDVDDLLPPLPNLGEDDDASSWGSTTSCDTIQFKKESHKAYKIAKKEAQKIKKERMLMLDSRTFDAYQYIAKEHRYTTMDEIDHIVHDLKEAASDARADIRMLVKNHLDVFVRVKDEMEVVYATDKELFTGAATEPLLSVFSKVAADTENLMQMPFLSNQVKLENLSRIRQLFSQAKTLLGTPAMVYAVCGMSVMPPPPEEVLEAMWNAASGEGALPPECGNRTVLQGPINQSQRQAFLSSSQPFDYNEDTNVFSDDGINVNSMILHSDISSSSNDCSSYIFDEISTESDEVSGDETSDVRSNETIKSGRSTGRDAKLGLASNNILTKRELRKVSQLCRKYIPKTAISFNDVLLVPMKTNDLGKYSTGVGGGFSSNDGREFIGGSVGDLQGERVSFQRGDYGAAVQAIRRSLLYLESNYDIVKGIPFETHQRHDNTFGNRASGDAVNDNVTSQRKKSSTIERKTNRTKSDEDPFLASIQSLVVKGEDINAGNDGGDRTGNAFRRRFDQRMSEGADRSTAQLTAKAKDQALRLYLAEKQFLFRFTISLLNAALFLSETIHNSLQTSAAACDMITIEDLLSFSMDVSISSVKLRYFASQLRKHIRLAEPIQVGVQKELADIHNRAAHARYNNAKIEGDDSGSSCHSMSSSSASESDGASSMFFGDGASDTATDIGNEDQDLGIIGQEVIKKSVVQRLKAQKQQLLQLSTAANKLLGEEGKGYRRGIPLRVGFGRAQVVVRSVPLTHPVEEYLGGLCQRHQSRMASSLAMHRDIVLRRMLKWSNRGNSVISDSLQSQDALLSRMLPSPASAEAFSSICAGLPQLASTLLILECLDRQYEEMEKVKGTMGLSEDSSNGVKRCPSLLPLLSLPTSCAVGSSTGLLSIVAASTFLVSGHSEGLISGVSLLSGQDSRGGGIAGVLHRDMSESNTSTSTFADQVWDDESYALRDQGAIGAGGDEVLSYITSILLITERICISHWTGIASGTIHKGIFDYSPEAPPFLREERHNKDHGTLRDSSCINTSPISLGVSSSEIDEDYKDEEIGGSENPIAAMVVAASLPPGFSIRPQRNNKHHDDEFYDDEERTRDSSTSARQKKKEERDFFECLNEGNDDTASVESILQLHQRHLRNVVKAVNGKTGEVAGTTVYKYPLFCSNDALKMCSVIRHFEEASRLRMMIATGGRGYRKASSSKRRRSSRNGNNKADIPSDDVAFDVSSAVSMALLTAKLLPKPQRLLSQDSRRSIPGLHFIPVSNFPELVKTISSSGSINSESFKEGITLSTQSVITVQQIIRDCCSAAVSILGATIHHNITVGLIDGTSSMWAHSPTGEISSTSGTLHADPLLRTPEGRCSRLSIQLELYISLWEKMALQISDHIIRMKRCFVTPPPSAMAAVEDDLSGATTAGFTMKDGEDVMLLVQELETFRTRMMGVLYAGIGVAVKVYLSLYSDLMTNRSISSGVIRNRSRMECVQDDVIIDQKLMKETMMSFASVEAATKTVDMQGDTIFGSGSRAARFAKVATAGRDNMSGFNWGSDMSDFSLTGDVLDGSDVSSQEVYQSRIWHHLIHCERLMNLTCRISPIWVSTDVPVHFYNIMRVVSDRLYDISMRNYEVESQQTNIYASAFPVSTDGKLTGPAAQTYDVIKLMHQMTETLLAQGVIRNMRAFEGVILEIILSGIDTLVSMARRVSETRPLIKNEQSPASGIISTQQQFESLPMHSCRDIILVECVADMLCLEHAVFPMVVDNILHDEIWTGAVQTLSLNGLKPLSNGDISNDIKSHLDIFVNGAGDEGCPAGTEGAKGLINGICSLGISLVIDQFVAITGAEIVFEVERKGFAQPMFDWQSFTFGLDHSVGLGITQSPGNHSCGVRAYITDSLTHIARAHETICRIQPASLSCSSTASVASLNVEIDLVCLQVVQRLLAVLVNSILGVLTASEGGGSVIGFEIGGVTLNEEKEHTNINNPHNTTTSHSDGNNLIFQLFGLIIIEAELSYLLVIMERLCLASVKIRTSGSPTQDDDITTINITSSPIFHKVVHPDLQKALYSLPRVISLIRERGNEASALSIKSINSGIESPDISCMSNKNRVFTSSHTMSLQERKAIVDSLVLNATHSSRYLVDAVCGVGLRHNKIVSDPYYAALYNVFADRQTESSGGVLPTSLNGPINGESCTGVFSAVGVSTGEIAKRLDKDITVNVSDQTVGAGGAVPETQIADIKRSKIRLGDKGDTNNGTPSQLRRKK